MKFFLYTFFFSVVFYTSAFAQAPTEAAPTPTCDAAEVISMFSDAYTDVTVDTWLTGWSAATGGGIVPIAGNDTRLYENVDFLGIETVVNQIDASGMETFNMDIWTPNMTTFRVKLVNFGPGGNSEHEIPVTPTLSGWNTLTFQMSDFAGLTGTSNIAQLILSGLPVGAGTVYVDNIYFATCGAVAPPSGPTEAAPTPTCDAAEVISMFSDAYTDVPVDTWLTTWSGATGGGIVPIAGNDARLYEGVDFLGIETVNNQIDASGMETFNIDIWTPNMTTFRVKLVNFGPGGNSEHEIAVTPTLAGWNTLTFQMADFSGLTGTSNIAQLILSGLPVGVGTLYIDNVYFATCGGVAPVVPTEAAPTPTCDAANVISMFSNAYTDVPVDTWLTVWSSASGGGITPIAGNDTRQYGSVNFLGIETVNNPIDASGMEAFNIDVWTPNMTTFRVKLVNFGPGGNSEHEIAFTPTLSGWNTFSIPMTDFTGLTGTSNIAQLILSGLPVGAGTLYIDNVYFSDCGGCGASSVALPATGTPATITCTTSCEDMEWTYYEDPANPGDYLFAIEWDPNSLGNNAAAKAGAVVTIDVDAALTMVDDGVAATWSMARYWNVTPGAALVDPVNVKFFYDAGEQSAVVDAMNMDGRTVEGFEWFKTVGVDFDPAIHITGPTVTGNSIPLTDVSGGATENGVSFAQFDGITSFSGGTGVAGVGEGTSPLPVELLAFNAKTVEDNVQLNWATASEVDNDYFQVERSEDGRTFTTIAMITGAGTTNTLQTYEVMDKSPFLGDNFYRLKQVDLDGEFTYSDIVLATVNAEREIKLYPVPVSDRLSIDYSSTNEEAISLMVTDALGRVVFVKEVDVLKGYNQLSVDFRTIPQGSYFVTIQSSSDRMIRIIMKK